MASAFIIWLYASILTFIIGHSVINLVLPDNHKRDNDPVAVILLGLCSLMAVVSLISIFFKIGLLANLAIVFVSAVLFLIQRKSFLALIKSYYIRFRSIKFFPIYAVLCLATLSIILIRTIDFPQIYDVGLYHAQSIRWIEEHQAVPGLVNLHSRLAINSSWFTFSAFFGFSFLKLQSFHVMNGWLMVISFLYSLGGLLNIARGKYRTSDILRALLIPSLLTLFPGVSSPSPDAPAALLIFLAVLFFLKRSEGAEKGGGIYSVAVIFLSFTALTVKLSAAPIVLLAVFEIGRLIYEKDRKSLIVNLVGSALIILPFIVRNVISSGYILFPAPLPGFKFLDWTAPYSVAVDLMKTIKSWAEMPGVAYTQVLGKGLMSWLPSWFSSKTRFYKILLILDLSLLLSYAVFALFHLRRLRPILAKNKFYIFSVLVCIAGIVFWFLNAPDVRCGLGFIAMTAALLVAPVVARISGFTSGIGRVAVVSLLAIYSLYTIGASAKDLPRVAKGNFLYPTAYPSVSLESRQINTHQIFYPTKGDQCWYAPLPCAPSSSSALIFRGASIDQGFDPSD